MKQYLKEMHNQFRYRANWEPNKPLQIGDIAILEKGILSIRSSLEKEGIPMEVRIDENEGSLKYNSSGSVEVKTKLSGDATIPNSALGELDAGFSINFSRSKSVVFQVNGTRTHIITNVGEIEKEVLKRFASNNWPKDWVIITELVEGKEGTIIISNDKESSIDLKATANISAVESLNIADTELGLSVVAKKNIGTEIIGKEGLTPLYRVSGIKTKLFGKPSAIGDRGESGFGSLQPVPFDDSEVDD